MSLPLLQTKHLPHICGDEPYTPLQMSNADAIYPTYVGMNRNKPPLEIASVHLPHVCGDEPMTGVCEPIPTKIYPTYVGMNRQRFALWRRVSIYPTYVGMNRLAGANKRIGNHLPHVCGDEPVAVRTALKAGNIYPTYVGMNRIPRRRRDLPLSSTPRMWG